MLFGESVVELINALFNMAHLVLLVVIIQILLREKRRVDWLEKRNEMLQKQILDKSINLKDPDKYPHT